MIKIHCLAVLVTSTLAALVMSAPVAWATDGDALVGEPADSTFVIHTCTNDDTGAVVCEDIDSPSGLLVTTDASGFTLTTTAADLGTPEPVYEVTPAERPTVVTFDAGPDPTTGERLTGHTGGTGSPARRI